MKRVVALLALLAAAPASGAESLPEWAEGSVSVAVTPVAGQSPAVDLYREEIVRFDGSERIVLVTRRVTRVMTADGRDRGVVSARYSSDGGKVRSLRVWIREPSGKVTKLGDDRATDVALVGEALYSDSRVRLLDGRDRAAPGSVIAAEAVVETRMPFLHFEFLFQERDPATRSRVRVEAPTAWSPQAILVHHKPLSPERDASGWTWELRDLPAVPHDGTAIPRIGVSLHPPSGASSREARSFRTWEEVSAWLSGLSESQSEVTPAVSARAKALTSGAATEADRVRAIAAYVQSVNYVAIQMGLGRGGGYRPHPATEVLANHYGDCKDKANLMRSLLRAVGIESRLVCIVAGDPAYVREEWPSPSQFDHCILGVRANADSGTASVTSPALGRWILFDPTDPHTVWGSLPQAEQGAFALLVAEQGGGLIRTPLDPPERNGIERWIDAHLQADGTLTGRLRELTLGTWATSERRAHRSLSKPEYALRIQRSIGQEVVVDSIRAGDSVDGRFQVEAVFRAPRYARSVAGFLSIRPLLLTPVPIGSDWRPSATGPIRVAMFRARETVRWTMPRGMTIEELPDSVTLEAPFGTYRAGHAFQGGRLTSEQSLEVRVREIPSADHAAARQFLDRVRAAENVQALLTHE